MRPLELSLLLLVAGVFLILVVRGRMPLSWLFGILAILTAFLALQVWLEMFRWQMAPLYIALLILAMILVYAIAIGRPLKRRSLRWIGFSIFIIFLIILGAFLSLALPISKLPVPTGPYAVGTSNLYLVDNDRPEDYTEDSSDVRELMVQLWYPIDKQEDGDRAEYVQQMDIAGPALAARLNLPSFLLDHLQLIRANSVVDAPIFIQDRPYPVLLFSHGLMGIRMQNSFQLEELASHGYVIASPDHTYDSVLTIMPDDRVLFHDNDALFPEDISNIEAGQNLVNVRSGDLSFVLSRLEEMNQDPGEMLFEQLSLNQVGFIGHSTGGGTVLETCFQDDRCKATVALDSWVEVVADENQLSELPVPVLFMNSEDWLGPENRAIGKALATNSSASSYEVTIAGAHHNNFTDIPLLSPLTPLLDLAGPVDGRRILKIINNFSVSFFDKYLKGIPGEMSDNFESTYPEVRFEVYRP